MAPIRTVRAAHLLGFVSLLRDIGTPVERELRRAGLPNMIEEMPHAWVSDVFAMRFIGNCAMVEGIPDIGWLGVKQFRRSDVAEAFQAAVSGTGTLCGRLKRFFEMLPFEDSSVTGGIALQGKHARIWCHDIREPDCEPYQVSEWYLLGILIDLVRSVMGNTWCPEEITFQSEFSASEEAYCEFANTRILFGQPRTSILIPDHLLAECPPRQPSRASPVPGIDPADRYAVDFTSQVRALITPYLSDRLPTIDVIAEMASSSVRTVQRRLDESGTSFSELVAQSRFGAARELLMDPRVSVTDVAFAVGYRDSSNFTRAFRRREGLSPSTFRRFQNEQADCAPAG